MTVSSSEVACLMVEGFEHEMKFQLTAHSSIPKCDKQGDVQVK